MNQRITLFEFLQNFGAGNSPPKLDVFFYSQLLDNSLQSFAFGAFAHQPVFALRKFLLELGECSQSKFESLQMQQISQTYHAENSATTRGNGCQAFDFFLGQSG